MSDVDGLKMLNGWYAALPKSERLALLMRRAEEMPPVSITVARAVYRAGQRALHRARKERDDLIAEILKTEAEP